MPSTLTRKPGSSYPYTEQMNRPLQNQPDRWKAALDDFAEANQRIVRAEMRITRQQTLIQQKVTNGHDTGAAEEELAVYAAALQTMHEYREAVLRRMNR